MQEFVYVSSVEGRIVTRFPSLQQSVAQYIGVRRILSKLNPKEPPGLRKETRPKLVWTLDEVIAIPIQEWNKYRREYRRAVADGALKMRTESDYKNWISKREKDSKKAKEAADEAKAKVAAEQVEVRAASDPAGVGKHAPDATSGQPDEQPQSASAGLESKTTPKKVRTSLGDK